MGFFCFKCGKSVDSGTAAKVPFREECPGCRSDMHVCLNCRHYDPAAYNQCHEPQAERVADRDRANRCEYFSFNNKSSAAADTKAKDTLKKLDDLFK